MVMEHLFWVRAEALVQNVCGVVLKDIIFYSFKGFCLVPLKLMISNVLLFGFIL